MITVENPEGGVRVTIPKGEVPPQRLNSFLDWLRLESIAAKSRLTEADADRLAEQAKADWWAANKSRFIAPGPGNG